MLQLQTTKCTTFDDTTYLTPPHILQQWNSQNGFGQDAIQWSFWIGSYLFDSRKYFSTYLTSLCMLKK